MMDEQIRQILTKIIDAARPHPFRYYHVCWWQGRIRCLHVHHTTEAHPVFLTMVGQVLTAGLSPRQWRVLAHRIQHFCRVLDLTLGVLSPRSDDARIPPSVRSRPRLTDFDCMRLQDLLTVAGTSEPGIRAPFEILRHLLETADVVPAENIPTDVVTMNSLVRLWDEDDAREMVLSLVFPQDACGGNLNKIRLSILTHMGLSMLGRKAGDVIEGGIRIDKLLYQPEAAGDFDL